MQVSNCCHTTSGGAIDHFGSTSLLALQSNYRHCSKSHGEKFRHLHSNCRLSVWSFYLQSLRPIIFPPYRSLLRVYLNQSSLQFFLQLFRVLRSCQKQWKAWELWKRSWGTLSLSGGKWIWRSCTNHPGMCWGSHSSIVKKPEVGHFRWTSDKELYVGGRV